MQNQPMQLIYRARFWGLLFSSKAYYGYQQNGFRHTATSRKIINSIDDFLVPLTWSCSGSYVVLFYYPWKLANEKEVNMTVWKTKVFNVTYAKIGHIQGCEIDYSFVFVRLVNLINEPTVTFFFLFCYATIFVMLPIH